MAMCTSDSTPVWRSPVESVISCAFLTLGGITLLQGQIRLFPQDRIPLHWAALPGRSEDDLHDQLQP